VLEPGQTYQVWVHTVCDTFPPSSLGDVIVDIDFEAP
jgi:hypothetical protein